MSSSEQLTPRQRRAIEALLTARSVTDAAQACGVSRRTLTSWLTLPQFQQALKQAQADLIDAAVLRLASGMSEGLDTLLDVMRKGDKDAARVSAVNAWRDWLFQIKQLHDFEERIRTLEDRANESKK